MSVEVEGYIAGWINGPSDDGQNGNVVSAQVYLPHLHNKTDDGLREIPSDGIVELGVEVGAERTAVLSFDIRDDQLVLKSLVGYLPSEEEVNDFLEA